MTVDAFNAVWLYAEATGGTRMASYTLEVPRRNVFAHIALSAYTPALHSDDDGAAVGVRILKYTSFKPLFNNNTWINVPTVLPADWNNNAVFIDQCSSITFGLVVKNAWAYGCGVVFLRRRGSYMTDRAQHPTDHCETRAIVFDALTGDIVLTHVTSSLAAPSRDRRAICEEAIEIAAGLSGRGDADLRALEAPDNFDEQADSRVDVTTGRLIREERSGRNSALGGLRPRQAGASVSPAMPLSVRSLVVQRRLDAAVTFHHEQLAESSRLAAQANALVRRLDVTRRALRDRAHDEKRKLEDLRKELEEIADPSFSDFVAGLFGDDAGAGDTGSDDTRALLTALRTEVLEEAVKLLLRAHDDDDD